MSEEIKIIVNENKICALKHRTIGNEYCRYSCSFRKGFSLNTEMEIEYINCSRATEALGIKEEPNITPVQKVKNIEQDRKILTEMRKLELVNINTQLLLLNNIGEDNLTQNEFVELKEIINRKTYLRNRFGIE